MDELYHHGIKGQKWGVKHGPPYPIDKDESILIKKGATMGHVTNVKNLKLQKGRGIYTYDKTDEADSDIFRGVYGTEVFVKKYGKKVYDYVLEAKEDLKLPSHKEKIDTFYELYKNNSDFKEMVDYEKDYASKLKLAEKYDYDVHKMYDAYQKGKINRETFLKIYDMTDEYTKKDAARFDSINKWYKTLGISKETDYGYFMASFNIESAYSKQSILFVNALKNKGYNAIIDDNDSGRYSGSNAPLYIFDEEQSVKIKDRSKLSDEERLKAMERAKTRNNGKVGF